MKAVSLAIARDGASGGVVRTVIVRSLADHNSLKLNLYNLVNKTCFDVFLNR